MTRINVVPVETLSRQHLIAEYREITRLPGRLDLTKLKLKLYIHYIRPGLRIFLLMGMAILCIVAKVKS